MEVHEVSANGREQVIVLSGKRGVIARRMVESLHAMAQLTLNSDANVTALVRLRETLKNQFDLTYTDLLVKAVALALRRHPRLNASVVGQEIHLHVGVHIGVAVALDDGLIVAVVRDADRKALKEIAQENGVLAERARNGKLALADVTGGTFTLTNLGWNPRAKEPQTEQHHGGHNKIEYEMCPGDCQRRRGLSEPLTRSRLKKMTPK